MAPESNGTTKISILYVEDDRETREILSSVLARGIRPLLLHIAEDGEAGLTLYREHRPDIVITDINMPAMDGIRMVNEIRSLNPDVAVIVVTALSGTSRLQDAVEAGISHYLSKPVDCGKLFQAIGENIQTVNLRKSEGSGIAGYGCEDQLD